MLGDSLVGDELEDSVDPRSLSRFLAVNHWAKLRENSDGWELWRAPEELDLRPKTVIVPLDKELEDFSVRLRETLGALLNAYSLRPQGLLEKIAALRADLFFVRIDQDSYDGTIPFKQAQRALESIATMVRAAATTTVNPNHSHKGRRPAEVENFLADDLRMGHTKKGSFIVTVAARHDWTEEDARSSDDGLRGDVAGDEVGRPTETVTVPDLGAPFARRVMTTLSYGLSGVRKLAARAGDDRAEIDETSPSESESRGLSLELAEALEKITNEEGLNTLSISFDWADAASPPPEDVLDEIVFDRPLIDALPSVSERLQMLESPRTVELVGLVDTLSARGQGISPEGLDSGDVTIYANVDDSWKRVTATLIDPDYDLAIQAYRYKIPVSISGDLVKRRSWRLEGNVRLDRGQLQAVLGYQRDWLPARSIMSFRAVDDEDLQAPKIGSAEDPPAPETRSIEKKKPPELPG